MNQYNSSKYFAKRPSQPDHDFTIKKMQTVKTLSEKAGSDNLNTDKVI
jgi:hypothetical protein